MSLLSTIDFITSHPLNRKHKLKSIVRFVKWQIGSRMVPGAVVCDWVNGSRFLVRTGETGLTQNIYTGLHEFVDMGFLLHFLRSEDLFVDIGANAGSYTILACSAVGARGYAFEPVPITYSRLIDNVQINNLNDKVKCINKGVGVAQENIFFTSDSGPTNHAVASGEESGNTICVEMTALDVALGDNAPALIKIDVEGYEMPVLEGAQETLANRALNSVIVELNGSGERYGFDEVRILEMMFDLGFRSYAYDPFGRTLARLDGKNNNSSNTLFVRDKSFVLERVRSSPKVSIHGSEF